MVYVIAALLGVGGWLLALLTRALFTWAVTARYQRKYGTPERLAQVRAPIDAILGGVVDEPIRFVGLWWLIAVTAAGTFSLTETAANDSPVILGVAFALGWALAEIVHLISVVAAASRASDEAMRANFKASGLTDARTIALRICAILLRNIGLTLILVALPILILITLTGRAAAALIAVRKLVNTISEKPQNTLLTSGLLAALVFAAIGAALTIIS